jgi:deoxyribodipyrimidine photolyase-related protein
MALEYLHTFLEERLTLFGPYEDAIHTSHCRLFHSAISPLLNIGLLCPETVLQTTIAFATANQVPIASLEGFVRQILGWREFIRAAYEVDGRKMRSTNFFDHTRPLALELWDGTTGIPPIDTAVRGALRFGYTHHIERLMVLGNFMLLSKTDPDEVYHWFMAMYVDAYDWVMVPNVYGMSQFADGGLFATKPYISGSNYIRKMSSYESGDWEELWTALYWNFIADHQVFFLKNHRLSMMPRLLIKMATEKRVVYLKRAATYLGKNI